ncbi:MAG: hypothetical protein J6U54_22965, partial [Clostridiales bacterium]|nr:hypothetical protein [Clostridiales bacterium]
YITELDVSVVNNFPKMSESDGKAVKIRDAIDAYQSRLTDISNSGFHTDDDSTAHAVIDSVNAQMDVILSILDNADVLFDEAIALLQEDVIDKEDQLAASVTD